MAGPVTQTETMRLWIGPSGWSYPDWAGIVYPPRPPRGFKPLHYLSQFFNSVEINTTFYQIPSRRRVERWPEQVPSSFRFAAKLTRTFTHERQSFPPQPDFDAYRLALQPLVEAGVMGPVLMQFPWSFRYGAESADWLRRLAERLHGFELFVEVRHASWLTPDAIETIRAVGGMCSIDQPQVHDCIPPRADVLGESAYVRLHGRNALKWFTPNVRTHERYDYLYSQAEIREWADRLRQITSVAKRTYVYANNHYRGQAPANALELRSILENRSFAVPPQLIDAFPRLAQIDSGPPPETQTQLFS